MLLFFVFRFWCSCLCDTLADLVIVSILVFVVYVMLLLFLSLFHFFCFFFCDAILFSHCFSFGVVVYSTLFLIWSLFQLWCCFSGMLLMFLSLFVRHYCCSSFGAIDCMTCFLPLIFVAGDFILLQHHFETSSFCCG